MAICAGGEPVPWSDAGRMTVHVVYREHVLNLEYSMDPVQSAAYLAGLVGDFFRHSPLIWLPFETLFSDSRPAVADRLRMRSTDAERRSFTNQ
jgi:hypothetical protein